MSGKSPKYQQVADTIAREIQAGRFAVGTLLPTEIELAVRFDVSRHTIRHGLRELRARGLIASRQGRGSEVRTSQPSGMGGEAVYFYSDFLSSDSSWPFQAESSQAIEAGAELSELMECAPGDRLVEVRGKFVDPCADRRSEPAPVVLYTFEAYAEFIAALDTSTRQLPLRLAEAHGLSGLRIVQEMTMEPVDGAQSRFAGKIAISRRYRTADDRLFLYLRTYCPPRVFSIVAQRENVLS